MTSSIQSILSTAGVPGCYFSSLSGLTRPPHQDAWQMVQQCISDLYSQSRQYYCGGSKPSHLTGIFCVSFSFLSCFCRVPRDFGSLEPRLPPALNPSFSLRSGLHQLRESLRLGMEAHAWLDCGDLPAMGAVFYLGAGWPQWKPWVSQAPTFHLSEAVG